MMHPEQVIKPVIPYPNALVAARDAGTYSQVIQSSCTLGLHPTGFEPAISFPIFATSGVPCRT